MEHPVIAVRNTELTDFASCRKRYELTWVRGIRPKKADKKLALGSMIHKFLEVMEQGLTNGVPLQGALAHGIHAMEILYNEYVGKLSEVDAEGQVEAEEMWEMAVSIANNYVTWRDQIGVTPMLIPEDKFEQPLGGLMGVRVVLKGTRDGISRPSDDEYFLREYKTCQSIKDKLKQYSIDKQTRRYIMAARKNGLPLMGVELVLIAKMVPLKAEDLILKSPKDGISKDMKKWNRLTYEEALRVPTLGKFVEEGAKNGLTEQGYHDILKVLKERDNPFFRLERIYFNDHELAQVTRETLVEAWTLQQTKELAETLGDDVWTRNQGIMGFNCKSCPVKEICEMELKGFDTSLLLQEHYEVVDPNTIGEEKDDGDEDDMGGESQRA